MVAALLHPLNIFLIGLGGGFLIPLFYRLGKGWLTAGFLLALVGLNVVAAANLAGILMGGPDVEVFTAGALPPVSISLRFGLWEGVFCVAVNLVALINALTLRARLAGNYGAMLLYLILVMGIDGMVMTRDLFNLFVFLEIVSIATYGLLGLAGTPESLAAGFKYIMATVVASTFYLLGTVLLYYATGTLSIDALIAGRGDISGPIATTALVFILGCLLVELKPFPANGWGLDVYETAPAGVAAMVSVGVSAGVFFALLKLLPLFAGQLWIIALSGGLTFLASNLIGLRQENVQRLFGYSSIGQMGLALLALALLIEVGAQASLALVVGGLFLNHLFAKAGLFWLAEALGRRGVAEQGGLSRAPLLATLLGLLIIAIAGLPPFPGFWAKWELVMQLTAAGKLGWVALVLVGSLMEAAYMFRWFFRVLAGGGEGAAPRLKVLDALPPAAAGLLLLLTGYGAARLSGGSGELFVPLAAGAVLFALDGLPGRVKLVLTLAIIVGLGGPMVGAAEGIARLFSALLLSGSVVIAAASLYRTDRRPGFYPLLAVMLLSIPALLKARTSLDFFFHWEMVTLSSLFLIAQGREAGPHVLRYLLFSLFSAFLVLVGFALVAGAAGSLSLDAIMPPGPITNLAFVLLAAGFLVKAGALGVHVWLPGAYNAADDDVTALLSGVVSKVAMFGLLAATYVAVRSYVALDLPYALAWVGMLTVVGGALLALRQPDFKLLLACSSMSQLGYIVVAIGLMNRIGWVTALYLVANHLLVKGILFLAVAAVALRVGSTRFADAGGLRRTMPVTFALVLLAVLSMSGLPPLMGFGGKWLLLGALVERGWHGLAFFGVLATFLGFLYMIRLVDGVFFGTPRSGEAAAAPAPQELIAAQVLLAAGILVLSLFPKLIMDPVAAAIDPAFASGLVWNGLSLEEIYTLWSPTPVMFLAVFGAVILGGALLLADLYARRQGDTRSVFEKVRDALAWLVPPLAVQFWGAVTAGALTAGGGARRIYTGNAQGYALMVLYYVLALYVATTGLSGLYP